MRDGLNKAAPGRPTTNRPEASKRRKHIVSFLPIVSGQSDSRHQRPQQSSPTLVRGVHRRPLYGTNSSDERFQLKNTTNDEEDEEEPTHEKLGAANRQSGINYWHYKQTGIKSRPIKLLKHPIEHIERKIILTYLLGFLFKLIAITTGPLIVLIVFLATAPFVALRRFAWFLLNLSFTSDARIRTLEESQVQRRLKIVGIDELEVNSGDDLHRQIYWNYCPLSYLETYWFKERLVNTAVLQIEHEDQAEFQLDKLQALVRDKLLCKLAFRKFLSRVVSRGLPLYKSYYWHHLGLVDEPNKGHDRNKSSQIELNFDFIDNDDAQDGAATGAVRNNKLRTNSLASSEDQFSSTSSAAQQADNIRINIESAPLNHVDAQYGDKVHLENHVFRDKSLWGQCVNRTVIRQYVQQLIDIPLNQDRPLWELRLVPITGERKSYLIFRCHQSLADGRSLSDILTKNLSLAGGQEHAGSDLGKRPSADSKKSSKIGDLQNSPDEDETQLKAIDAKRSFVERVSESNSIRSAILVGPLTVLLWVIWTFTRRKNNHLHKRASAEVQTGKGDSSYRTSQQNSSCEEDHELQRRFYMSSYSLTKIHQIKQMTRSKVSDVILCALSGALRDYLRKFNGVTNPPNLNISLTVDMRQEHKSSQNSDSSSRSSSGGGQFGGADHGAPSSSLEQVQDDEVWPEVKCTLVNVPLPTSVEGTVPRLWELRNTMDELRSSADPWVMVGLQRFLFHLMPIPLYQWLINYVALRNSSTFVSNIRGPQNLVEAWCVDLLQRAIFESQQPPRIIQTPVDTTTGVTAGGEPITTSNRQHRASLARLRTEHAEENKEKRVKLCDNLGSIVEIYYCMQPPTGDIPISFNCISYHNRLFVTALSRSLLVEDSKLLSRLFFRQLNQLASTIAKRRSLVTIVRTPAAVPIEISCQPASPPSSTAQSPTAVALIGQKYTSQDDEEDERRTSHFRTVNSIHSTNYRFKDDLEANLGASDRSPRCSACEQSVCTCRRRKSLFNFDHHHQRNLLSLLIPNNLLGQSRSGSKNSELNNPTNECLCGQQLLEELDEERPELDGGHAGGEALSTGSRTPSDDGGRAQMLTGGGRMPQGCTRCNRTVSKRSTLSLNEEIRARDASPVGARPKESSTSGSLSRNRGQRTALSSAQLNIPKDEEFRPKVHSKSETDLLPALESEDEGEKTSGVNQRSFRESWFGKGRFAMFTRSASPTSSSHKPRRSMSSRSSTAHMGGSSEAAASDKSKHRNLIELPVGFESGNKNYSLQHSRRRRQSVATTTGASHIHCSVVVKDKINNDVSLRYQLDSPFLGIRNRRFSAIGNVVVGSQRRASLLPFGLMHNQSLPKMPWHSEAEAHL